MLDVSKMKMTVKAIGFAIFVLASCTFVLAQDKIAAFDKYVEASRKAWNVPGMSLVVVKDGKVLLSKGYGVRELGRTEAVTNETLFGCMSTTKAMVAVAMGVLVDEGKVSWDDKVSKFLPEFRVADPYVTSELRVRDLFTHNAGLGNADFLWGVKPELSPEAIMRRMQYAQPAYSFRGGFIYQNIMYLVAGQVIERASGMPWGKFVTERVFGPLGMKNTFPTIAATIGYPNRSKAHFEIKHEIKVIPETSADSIAPAGAAWSTSDDMGKWVLFLLGDGKPLLKTGTLNEILKPQVMASPSMYPTFEITKPHWVTYGFGWFQHDYRGEMVDFHTGSLAGRTAIVGLIKDKHLGIYIFGNLDHAEVRHALMYKAFDLFGFNDDSRDWNAEMKKLYGGLEAESEKDIAAQKARRLPNTKPSLPLSAYVGTYSDPFYGTMRVEMNEGKLRLIFADDLTADLEHWHLDTFLGTWSQSWLGETLVAFQLDPISGEVAGLSVAGETLQKEAKSSR
jgi:CubicO group peptidase (beta-lactamase class C family)